MNTKEIVIKARVEDGLTYSRIKEMYGVAKSTARDWVSKFEEMGESAFSTGSEVQGYTNENFQRERPQRFKKTESEVLDFLSQLAPIKINNERRPTSSSLTDYAVVGSDFHFGCEDKRAISIFLQTIEELQPSTIILNGDTMDMLAISKYPKDLKHQWSLIDERIAYHKFLDELISISGGAKIYETYSNHSGQSIQGRWRRYLSDRIGELGCIPEIVDTLSYENVFMGDYQRFVEHVDFVQLNDLVVTHGTTVRGKGGASCIGEVDKWSSSIMHGHTHRIGASCKRVPAFGNRPEKQLYGFEGGCLCSLDAAYGQHMNWQLGFNLVSLDSDGVGFGVEQAMILNGSANITTLGKTIRG
jgi:transposase